MTEETARDVVHLSREYRPALMAFFLRRVHSHAEAEDLTQEVFSRLASQEDLPLQSGSAYLFQTAANLLRDRARRAQVRAEYLITLGEIEAQGYDPLDPFRFAAALDELDETMSTIFALYRLEHMSKEVIADTFGISVRAVERHLTRAMALLTVQFGDEI